MNLGEITLLQVKNVGKISFASLRLSSEGDLVKIAGPNESGKSTLLDSIKMAFESAKSVPNDIIRHGQDKASITIETSGGYTISRKIEKTDDGEQRAVLEVKYMGAPVAGGAVSFLKQFSAAYMDPQSMAEYGDADILRVMAKYAGVDLDANEKTIQNLKSEAQSIRNSIKSLGKKDPPQGLSVEPIDLEEATAEYAKASETYNQAISKHQSATSRIRELDNLIASSEQELSDLQVKISALETKISTAKESREKGQAWLASNPPPDQKSVDDAKKKLDLAVAAQSSINSAKEYELWYKQRENLNKSLEENEEAIRNTESARNLAMENASFPEKTLKISTGRPWLGDGLWSNASTSSKLIASAKLCASSIPDGGARVLYIHRGESIGTERQMSLAKFAKENNVQIFMEVMSDTPESIPDSIIIEDGYVEAGEDKNHEPKKEEKQADLFGDAPWNQQINADDLF